MIGMSELKKALAYGSEKGYDLFPEIKNKNNFYRLYENEYTKKEIEKVSHLAREASQKPLKPMTFSMFKKFETTGDRTEQSRLCTERLNELGFLVLDSIVRNTDEYIEMIQDRIWDLCDSYLWASIAHVPMSNESIKDWNIENPDEVIDLLAAETAFQLVETIYLLGDKMDAFLVRRVKQEINRRIFEPYTKYSFWWEGCGSNWEAVCAGCIASTAMYLIKDDHKLSIILKRALDSMQSYIDGFDPDGVTTEGFGYWGYGFSNFMFFAELLRDRTAGKICLLETSEKLKKIALFPSRCILSNDRCVNFADCIEWEGRIDYGLAARLEKLLKVQGLRSNSQTIKTLYPRGNVRFSYTSRSIFWGVESMPEEKVDNMHGFFYFPQVQWLICKGYDDKGKFAAFAAKGGHNAEHHNHNDIGHWILHYNGINILADLGTPLYTKDYFQSSTRYQYLCSSSKGHSVPVINGVFQGAGSEFSAAVIHCIQGEKKHFFKLDMKNAYPLPELIKQEREFIWDIKEGQLEIEDVFEFNKEENTVEEVFITRVKPEIAGPGKVLIKEGCAFAEILYEHTLDCRVEEEKYMDYKNEVALAYRICVAAVCDKSYISNVKVRILQVTGEYKPENTVTL